MSHYGTRMAVRGSAYQTAVEVQHMQLNSHAKEKLSYFHYNHVMTGVIFYDMKGIPVSFI